MPTQMVRNAWDGFVRFFPVTVTICIAVISAAVVVGQRLETPEVKAERIQLFLQPLKNSLEDMRVNIKDLKAEFRSHNHDVVNEQVRSIREDVAEIKDDVRAIKNGM